MARQVSLSELPPRVVSSIVVWYLSKPGRAVPGGREGGEKDVEKMETIQKPFDLEFADTSTEYAYI